MTCNTTHHTALQGDENTTTYQPAFSVIMPTYNRKNCICSAIKSLLKQTYTRFELIIVDDGSTDDTEKRIQKKYAAQLQAGQIKYIRLDKCGVCRARNVGLAHAQNEWIAYLDTDNEMLPTFLETFSSAISKNSSHKIFYGKIIHRNSKREVGHAFDYKQLIVKNYIDVGVFVHHRSVYQELGGFDEQMRRQVDWEMILRYVKKFSPYFIDKVLLRYNDSTQLERITTRVDWRDDLNYIKQKHSTWPWVSTVITSYNQEKYIEQALQSAVSQKGEYRYEVLVSDDGSTDATAQIIDRFAKQYPHIVRNISHPDNWGISKNMKYCFEQARGEYVAVLEGDDYWTDSHKLDKQKKFLEQHPGCSMVFSRVALQRENKRDKQLLERHHNLPEELTGEDFVKRDFSLIVNFSCTMFRQKLLQNLPSVLYQYRLSEIALAFYLEHYGAIGYIKWPLSVYRLHSGGVWSGSKPIEQLLQHKHVMLTTQAVCLQKYKPAIMKDIEHTDEKIRALQERALLPKKGGVKQFFKKVIAVFSKKKISFLFF